MKGANVSLDVAKADRLQQVSELGSHEWVAADRELMVVERHPIAQRIGAVRVQEECGVEHLVADDGRTGGKYAPDLAEHAGRIADMLEHPAKKRRIEGLRLEFEPRRVHLENLVSPGRPRDGR